MPKTKDKPSIAEVVETFCKLELADQIAALGEIQEIVCNEILKAKAHISDYEKINGKK